MRERVLIVGCGYVGGRLAELLVADGRTVYGLKRDPSTLPAGVEPVRADVSDPGSLAGLPAADVMVYAVAPSGRTESAYRLAYVDGVRNVLAAVGRGDAPGRVILVSSTGVYGHDDGRRVDEETPPEPATLTGEIVLEGERALLEAAPGGVVLRLGGIYGPGRNRTVRRVIRGEAGCPGPDRYGNRIHRDDAAGALRHLLALPDPEPVYLGVDRDPAPLREVYRWVAERAGVPDPCRAGEAVDPDEGRRGGNKRCSSDRLAASGYEWHYPTFREGYATQVDALR
ncbi:MAG: SDR family oxidoreductase [Gemmatimonadota bacterium]